ncbi:MAG: hypothetical protein II798_00670 [Lachnospiraceae bacterium]|nr:hypothetical protein [Lachnospiraceae bacterium]
MRELFHDLHRKYCFSRFPMYFLSTSLFGLLPKASEICFLVVSDVFPLRQHVSPAAEGIGNFASSRFPMYFLLTSMSRLLPKASEILFFGGFRCISSSPACLACCRRHRKICFLVVSDVFSLHQHVSLAAEGIGNFVSPAFRCISSEIIG